MIELITEAIKDNVAATALVRWLVSRPRVGERGLFVPQSAPPHPALRSPLGHAPVERAFRSAGVDGMKGTHCMRKTFAANVHRVLQGDLFGLSRAMRHSSPLTCVSPYTATLGVATSREKTGKRHRGTPTSFAINLRGRRFRMDFISLELG
jgi:hypothetical protein